MYQITQITAAARQEQNLVLPDGSFFSFNIYYNTTQAGWFITEIGYGSFTVSGIRICISPDLLYQFSNLIPFGLMCYSTTGREPTLQEDFFSGDFSLFILTQAEVAEYTTQLQS